YTTLFLSNQYFDKLSAAYASPDSDYFLLLHTWSLAIEWQWYFFFALFATILTLLVSKFKRKFAYKPFLYGWLLLTLTATIIVILISLYSSSQHYYSLNMRAFEFLIGGSVALLKDRIQITNRWITNPLAVVAIAVLICTSGLSIPVEAYPNSWTLLVCLASAILLINQNTFVNRTLQLAPINYTGKISYSLYLWHWPIFAAFNYLEITLSGKTLCIALVITAGLAVLTYHGIEERFRRVKLSFAKSMILLVLLPLTVCTGLYTLTVKTNGLPQRFSDEYNHSLQLLNSASENAASRDGCLSGSQDLTDCQFGDHEGSKKAFLIGDSNANHFWGFYDVLAK
ncbi:acyltransferase, partial [Enterobacter hormaechei]